MSTTRQARNPSANDASTQPVEAPAKNRPVHEVRLGRICGAIWAHEGDTNGRTWHNVTLSRIYKDDRGNWARSDSFGKNELPVVIKVEQHVDRDIVQARIADRVANLAKLPLPSQGILPNAAAIADAADPEGHLTSLGQ
jgi:hypothetical protein